MKQIIFIMFISLLISSCGTNQKNKNFVGEVEVLNDAETFTVNRQAAVKKTADLNEATYNRDKKIIKDASVGVEVDDYTEYRILLDSLVNTLKGYISNDNLNKSDYAINGNLTIRIPAKNFNNFINLLERGSQKLLYKNISARDVTEEFIDIEARLKTKKEVEKRYRELLSKARNVKEILEVEEKLRIIREEIEAREGRLNYLKKQVAFSTIHLQITQKLDYRYEPAKQKNFFQRLFKSLDKGWKGFVVFLLFLVRIWPVLLIGFLTFYYIRRVRRKRKLKKEEERRRYKQKRYYHKSKRPKTENKSNTNNKN